MKLLLAVLFAFPLFHSSHAPAVFRTRIDTTAGSFVIEIHRDWSPNGADRFYQLVRAHYYDNSRFFRVVPGRWVQFGIAGDPKIAQAWRGKTIPDDILKVHNQLGYVAFSNTGPGTRSTQVYINLGDNSARNDSEPAFAPFGKIVEGWDVVEKLYGGYGENSGSGMRAGHQDKIFEGGNVYMDKEFPKLDRLIRATIIRETGVNTKVTKVSNQGRRKNKLKASSAYFVSIASLTSCTSCQPRLFWSSAALCAARLRVAHRETVGLAETIKIESRPVAGRLRIAAYRTSNR